MPRLQEYPKILYEKIPKSGKLLSKIGFGTFRSFNPFALKEAIENGINLIDTSSHFGNGAREAAIGSIVSQYPNLRSHLTLSTKAGYIYNGKTNFKECFQIKDSFYSIHPDYLQYSITESLKRLQVDYLDIFMLNNPERLLQVQGGLIGKQRLMEMIDTSSSYLQQEVKDGRIKRFGICSNSIGIQSAPDHFDVTKFVGMDGFEVVQYPLNLFEQNAINSQFGDSLAEKMIDQGIYQITNRPFNAITPNGVLKLVKRPLNDHEINEKVTLQFEKVVQLEQELESKLEGDITDSILLSKFCIAQIIGDNLSRLVTNEMACKLYFDRDLKPELEKDFEYLKDSDLETEFVESFIKKYKKVTVFNLGN
ncbi:hypothetical protein HK103_003352 [Boothiomyces macroporosus]|uniref:NADP-dependent oxidoreductase domain-containing protein n=1 Tax=Boothiomyces macroporosus TaxID=261099 RepID=A0AAD5UI22_9FUNG|nr:hypothetical protein HK103_003352 [Boothiomyces macroporosus]